MGKILSSKASLGYTVRCCLNKKKINKIRKRVRLKCKTERKKEREREKKKRKDDKKNYMQYPNSNLRILAMMSRGKNDVIGS